MKNILFVDDEPRLLDALQRMLRPQHEEWEMRFATSGEEALALLQTHPCDVIVTDMRMPGMDGARLLEYVRDRYPGVIRIVLSGYFEMESAMRAASVAHQFLAKPCDTEGLRKAIERSCSLAGVLPDEVARRVVGAIGDLPALPQTGALLTAALEKPDVSLEEISAIIEQDVGISAKVLQLVNSAFFGLVQRITSVPAAINYLGFDVLRQLVLSIEVFRTFRPGQAVAGFVLAEFQNHSRLVANLAARFPAPKEIAGDCVVAGLLHDTGKLVLAARLPRQFAEALRASVRENRPLYELERERTGAGHPEIGGYLLGLWGLPAAIVEAVCLHHDPVPAGAAGRPTVSAIVHVADAVAHLLHARSTRPRGEAVLDAGWLRALGMDDDQAAAWRALAETSPQALAGP